MSVQPARKLNWSSGFEKSRVLKCGSRARYAVTPMHDEYSTLPISKKTEDIMVARDLVVLLAEWLRKADQKSVDWRKAVSRLIRLSNPQPTKAKRQKHMKQLSLKAAVTTKRRGRPPGRNPKPKTSPLTSENGKEPDGVLVL